MPANKRRSRHGTNTTPSSAASSAIFFKSTSLPSATIANGTNHINHHLNHNNISLKSSVVPTVLNGARVVAGDGVTGIGTVATGAAAGAVVVGAVPSTTTFTLKQQQQLDRNAFLLTLTKDQLKVECRKRGQKSTGTKAELLQRVGFKMSLQHQQEKAQNNGGGVAQKSPAKPQKHTANGTSNSTQSKSKVDKEKERAERERIVLWYHPVLTLKYSALETVELLRTYGQKTLENKLGIAILVALVAVLSASYHVPGTHQVVFDAIRANLWFVVYWIGLGVLSSVGFGSGLHTFLLYLGPHIASVTLAAYECNSLNFPSPPYPDEIICPEEETSSYVPSLWSIMSKVRLEAFLWGAGTALGELPPYFMAKASRLSGYDPDDADDLKEFEELNKKQELGVELSMLERAKIFMERTVERVGFFGILACASIPNPLFDLAGITCGHFLVPFWTFFGATLLGKAVIKMHIQKVFVIIAFSETLVEKAVDVLGIIPFMGKHLQEPFKAFLQNEKTRLHRSSKEAPKNSPNIVAKFFEYFVVLMIVYFVISIVNSLAQSYHKRIHKKGAIAAIATSNNNKSQRKIAKD